MTATRVSVARLAALLALITAGCDQPREPAALPPPAREPAAPADVAPAPAPDAAAPPAPLRGAPFRIERAAAAGPSRVFAVASQRLWHIAGDRWAELPVDGASVRDVTALNGVIWVLTRGVGANAGHVTVLRSSGRDDLAVAHDFVTPAEHDPRALAVTSEREFFVGGASPSLLRGRFVGALQTNVHTLPATVDKLLYMPDQMMAVTYVDGTVGMFRWGETNAVERPDYLFSFTGMRDSLIMRRDGAVWRGRVWEAPVETDRLSSASGITPVAAATLRDQRVVEIDARARSRMLQDGRWSDVEVPEAPAAVVGLYGGRSLAEGLCVMVDRDGGVFELVGARWVRRVAPPTGEVR